jgi:adenylate cyclase class IV
MITLEIEAKFINIDPDTIRENLKTQGFILVYPEFLVERVTFLCRDNYMTLRVRKEYGKITMTYKYTHEDG